jgi:hypothetical protein
MPNAETKSRERYVVTRDEPVPLHGLQLVGPERKTAASLYPYRMPPRTIGPILLIYSLFGLTQPYQIALHMEHRETQ